MIRSFACKETAKIFDQERSGKLPGDIQQRSLRKLLIIHAAHRISDLRVPPGNRLEELSGTRKGQHSIRVNDQWRICFQWEDGDAHEVEIVDYH